MKPRSYAFEPATGTLVITSERNSRRRILTAAVGGEYVPREGTADRAAPRVKLVQVILDGAGTPTHVRISYAAPVQRGRATIDEKVIHVVSFSSAYQLAERFEDIAPATPKTNGAAPGVTLAATNAEIRRLAGEVAALRAMVEKLMTALGGAP